jgi:hypothetical protein
MLTTENDTAEEVAPKFEVECLLVKSVFEKVSEKEQLCFK